MLNKRVTDGNVSEFQRIAVLVCRDSEYFDAHRAMVKRLRNAMFKQADLYVAFSNDREISAFNPSLKDFPFSPASFTWSGAFLSPELRQSLHQHYDLVLDLSFGESLEADVVLARLPAVWRAGVRKRGREKLLDFMIEAPDQNEREVARNLEQYLLNSKKKLS